MMNPMVHRASAFPRKLIVDIHSYCNARCTMCPYPQLSRRQSQGVMDRRLYRRIVDQLGRIGRQHHFRPALTYCYMGEPFLCDELADYVAEALEQDIDVYLNTNASRMTPGQVDALLRTGFAGRINISMPGASAKVYERISGLDYAATLKNVDYLLSRYDPGRVLIRGVDDGWPLGEKQRWYAYWRRRGVRLEYLPPISRCGRIGRLLPDKRKQRPVVKLYGCRNHHPLLEMVILYDGRAVMCCQDMGRELIWGDVAEEGILGVWHSAVRTEAINRLYGGRPASRSFLCSRCEQGLTAAQAVQMLLESAWRKYIAGRPA
ncbi:MAG: radical SAM protein [Sedimentisphaerales bacterium]|nr:radical SAM protein [Sedimentisphaerales bacterium]